MRTARARKLALSLALLAAPSFGAPRVAVAAPPVGETEAGNASPTASLSSLLLDLGKAQALADEDPGAGVPRLRRSIDALREVPESLSADPAARLARVEALLVLARAQLNLGDTNAATASASEALREALGDEVDAMHLGPSLASLVAEAREALGPRAQLRVECHRACALTVNEAPVPLASGDRGEATLSLWPGTYRIRVQSRTETGALGSTVESHDFELSSEGSDFRWGHNLDPHAGADARLDAPLGVGEAATAAPSSGNATGPSRPHRANARGRTGGARLLPRWAELTGMAVGAGAIVAGAVLLVKDGRCSDGGSPTGPAACDDLYKTAPAGYALVGVGGLVLASGTVLLSVDEVRVRRSGERSARVQLRIRF